MKKLHNKDEYSTRLKPEGGLQASLCSNNVLSCGTPLGFNSNEISEDVALDYLADILVEAFLDKKNSDEQCKQKTSSNICTSINKRTS